MVLGSNVSDLIQMKAIEQHFPVVPFTVLYKVVLTFEFVMKSENVTIQVKTIEQYVLVVLLIVTCMLYKESVMKS